MPCPERVGYVLKMYPRFSETFVVNEILAHEAAGLELEIFSLRPPADGRFHDLLAHVRAQATYVDVPGKAGHLWEAMGQAAETVPGLWETLAASGDEDVDDVAQALEVARIVREREIKHLHAHFGSVATSVARLAARMACVTYSFTAHAKDIFHESVRQDDLRRKLADASAVVAVSRYNADHLRERFGAAASGVRCIYNGLDLERFPFSSPEGRPPKVVAVGRLVEKKGFADLVDACALLAAQGREVDCEIVGAGPLEEELEGRIAALGLRGRVRLLGPRPQHELAAHVQGAAALAAPCVVAADGNADGLPTVLLEAMALGTPCVATAVTGIPEVVRDGETGLLVSPRNPGELALAVERLLDDEALRVRLAAGARRLVEERFEIHRNAARIRELFGGRRSSAVRDAA